jgi:hypothetical protein
LQSVQHRRGYLAFLVGERRLPYALINRFVTAYLADLNNSANALTGFRTELVWASVAQRWRHGRVGFSELLCGADGHDV